MALQDYLSGISDYTSGAKSDMDSKTSEYARTLSDAGALPAKLKEALQKKLDYNKDLINQREGVMSEYFTAPSTAREKYQDVFNPFTREKLVDQYTASTLRPFSVLTDVLSQRMGTVSDTVQQGVSGWQSVVNTAKALADAAAAKYQGLLGEYQWASGQQAQEDQRATQEDQFNRQLEQQMKIAMMQYSGSGGGGGSSADVVGGGSVDEYVKAMAEEYLINGTVLSQIPAKLVPAVINEASRRRSELAKEEAAKTAKAAADEQAKRSNSWLNKLLKGETSGQTFPYLGPANPTLKRQSVAG